MAHFAELDESLNVIRVLVVNNSELLDDENLESEIKGVEFCSNLFGGNWVQTSYNGNIRKNFAGVGFTYNPDLDAFIPPKCHDEAELDIELCLWVCNNSEHENIIKQIS